MHTGLAAIIRRLFRWLPFNTRSKKYFKYAYFRAMAAIGVEEFPALNQLDRKMLARLPPRGVFVEAGANDGISQSNTWFLETYRGWSGLLIEPVPELAALARRFRRAPVANVALGRKEDDGSSIDLLEADLMTVAERGTKLAGSAESHASAGGGGRRITARVRSLSALLDEYQIPSVDFFSLGVEGFELSVLQGLDLDRHAPTYLLVETAIFARVNELLQKKYDFVERLSDHDYLFQRRDNKTQPSEASFNK